MTLTLNYNFEIGTATHTKTGEQLRTLKIIDSLSKENYITVAQTLKKINGYYSKFLKAFIIPFDAEIIKGAQCNTENTAHIQVKKSLFDRCIFTETEPKTKDKNYKFVGCNFFTYDTKEIAKIIRQHLKKQFPEVKFSVTSGHNSINISIKKSPFNYSKLAYNPNISHLQYRAFEEKNNPEINAILNYVEKYAESYNFDDSDTMTDYFHTNFYLHVCVDYDYQQTEPTEEEKDTIKQFRDELEAHKKQL